MQNSIECCNGPLSLGASTKASVERNGINSVIGGLKSSLLLCALPSVQDLTSFNPVSSKCPASTARRTTSLTRSPLRSGTRKLLTSGSRRTRRYVLSAQSGSKAQQQRIV